MANQHPKPEPTVSKTAFETVQLPAARIAGALAHEINNPLQGVQTLVGILSRDCSDDRRHALHLEQIRSGLARIARIIDVFAVAYENIPREPDTISPPHFVKMLDGAAFSRQMTCIPSDCSAFEHRRFRCMVPETVRLIAEAFAQAAGDERSLHTEFGDDAGRIVLTCRRNEQPAEQSAWALPSANGAVSGVAVLLAELTQMAGGTAEFSYDDKSLTGIRLVFQDGMISR